MPSAVRPSFSRSSPRASSCLGSTKRDRSTGLGPLDAPADKGQGTAVRRTERGREKAGWSEGL
jgi:hypothetical protein